jgi:hypothetical protein
MATPQFADLQQQAEQRINPFLKGLSMLTGGIAGELTGTNEQIRQQRFARRALLQEELQKRDEQRALERQLMINALQQGVGQLEGATFEERMADFQKKRLQKQIIEDQGYIYGIGQSVGPSPYESDPTFKAGALRGEQELSKRKATAALEEQIQGKKIEDEIRGFGATPRPGAPTGELRGQLERLRMETQSRIPVESRASQAKAELTALQGMGFVPSPMNIESLTPEQAIAQADIYGRKYQQESYVGAFDRKVKAERKAIDEFNVEAGKDSPDQTKLKTLFYDLPTDAQKDARNRMIAGVTQAPTPKERESLVKYREMLGGAQNIATSLSSLAGSENLAKVSRDNFNGFQSWLRGIQNKYGSEDSRLRTINDIVQQFEAVVAGKRKDLFGASLTGNELESARQQFADPKSANFLPRMVQFLDGVFSRDVVNEDYKQFGIQVPAELEKTVQDARQKWLTTREQLNFGSLGGTRKTSQSRVDSLRNEAAQLRQALGMTNAPSLKR